MLPLSQIMRKNQIAYHSYADDTQIYLALSPNDYSPIESLCQCIDEINSWMCQNFLQLNKEKTEVIAFGNKDEVLKVNAYLDSRGQTTKNQVRNLGVILETDLSFSSHVKAVTKSAYYHLKNIARIRCFVSSQDLEKLVHAFITSRVDYCNGLLTGLPKKTIRQLQLIQNAAARILTRTRTSEHITPVLRSLHWLPVTFRIDFKVLLLVYKSLNGLGLKYMSDMLTEYKPNRPLRSLGSSQLEIPRVHTKQGESTFSLEVCTGSKLKPKPGPYPRSSDPTRPAQLNLEPEPDPKSPPPRPTTNNKKKRKKVAFHDCMQRNGLIKALPFHKH